MKDIFHCFYCNKKLSDVKRSKATEDKYFFWCGKKCHDAYEKKIEEDGRVQREWSDFMCCEGPCPEEMLDKAREMGYLGENNWMRTGPPPVTVSEDNSKPEKKGGRKCGICGKTGHNARTCPENPKNKGKTVKAEKAPKPRKGRPPRAKTTTKRRRARKGSKRKQYQCGKCGGFGHNARTCKR